MFKPQIYKTVFICCRGIEAYKERGVNICKVPVKVVLKAIQNCNGI